MRALVLSDVALLLRRVLLVELVNRALRLADGFLPLRLRSLVARLDLSSLFLAPFPTANVDMQLTERRDGDALNDFGFILLQCLIQNGCRRVRRLGSEGRGLTKGRQLPWRLWCLLRRKSET